MSEIVYTDWPGQQPQQNGLLHSSASSSPSARPNSPGQHLRKATLSVRRSCNGDVRRIAFFPDSTHTSAESLHALFVSAFNISSQTKFFLEDEEDGTLVPLDKSLCYLRSVRLVEIPEDEREASDAEEAHAKALRLAKLLDISSSISSEAQPEKAVQTIVHKSKEVLPADRIVLYILDSTAKVLVVAASSEVTSVGDEEELDEEMCTDEETEDASTKLSLMTRIPLDSSHSLAADSATTGEAISTPRTLCVPVTEASGEILGVIEAIRLSSSEDFDQHSMHALEFISTCTGSVLHRLQLWYHSSRAEDRAQALLKVTKMLAAAKQPEEVIKLVVKEAYDLLHAERVAVFLVHAQEKELEICLSKDASGTRIPMTAGLAGYVARTGESVNVLDVRNDERFLATTDMQTGFRTRAVLCCPIFDSAGKVIGVIQALNKRSSSNSVSKNSPRKGASSGESSKWQEGEAEDDSFESFTEDDRELLEMLTQSAGVTLQNAQLLQAAEHARVTTRALLRLVQQIVGEPDFLKLDRLLRSCCKQLVDCDRCVLAWINRADSTLRIFLDEGQSLTISLDDKRAIEATIGKLPTIYNCPNLMSDPSGKKSRYAEKVSYTVQSVLSAPIGGGIQGPIAVMLAFNKLEPESSLTSVATSATGNTPRRLVSRAYKPFSKEDETDMLVFCNEVEGALRVKRNLQMDFARLLLGQSDDDEEEAEGGEDDSSRLKRQSSSSSSDPILTKKKVDAQQRRLMLLYSSFDEQKPVPTGSSSSSTLETANVSSAPALESKVSGGGGDRWEDGPSKIDGHRRKRKQDALLDAEVSDEDVSESSDQDEQQNAMSPRKQSRAEQEARTLVRSTLSDFLNLDILGQTLETCKSWTLALFFSEMPMLRSAGVDLAKFPMFVSEVHDHYNANPFHNFYHAFAVFHTSFDLIKHTMEGRKLDPLCALSILLASLCHDIGHKGMTNSYESATMSELAIQYSDEAVLERYHAYMAFKLLYQQTKSNILGTMSHSDMVVVRKYIIEGILATDMRRHAEHVAELEQVVIERRRSLMGRNGSFYEMDFLRTPTVRSRRTSIESSNSPISTPNSPKGSAVPQHHRRSSSFVNFVYDSELALKRQTSSSSASPPFDTFFSAPEGKSLLVRSIVHSADLSSQTLKTEFAEDWGRRITAEFSAQAEVERSMGLPVSVPVCNTDTDFFNSQVFFIRQIVLPLWRGLGELLPELAVRVDALERNLEYYDRSAKTLSGVIAHGGGIETSTNKRPVSPLGLEPPIVLEAPKTRLETRGSSRNLRIESE